MIKAERFQEVEINLKWREIFFVLAARLVYSPAPMRRAILIFFALSNICRSETVYDLAVQLVKHSAELESIREANAREMDQEKSNTGKIMILVHLSTQMERALKSQSDSLNSTQFDSEQSSKLATALIKFDDARSEINSRIKSLAQHFLSGQIPQSDHGTLLAKMPELRADLEDLNKAVGGNFASLVILSMLQPIEGQRWQFNRKQKQNLILEIKNSFGNKLNSKQPNYYVLPAWLMMGRLAVVKASDE